MSPNRRLEYDKGPSPDEERTNEPADQPDDGESGRSIGLEDAPWKVGSLAGVGAFVAVYAVAFQLVNAVYGFSPPDAEAQIGRATMAGFLTLGSHGVGVVTEDMQWHRYGLEILVLFTPLLVALAALVVLLGTGYAVTRYVGPETPRETLLTAACIVPGYFLAALLTAQLARHTPELPENAPPSAQEEVSTLGVSVDATFVLVFVLVPFTFALIGAAVANRSVLFGTAATDDGDESPVEANNKSPVEQELVSSDE